jgi:hypothetical protein
MVGELKRPRHHKSASRPVAERTVEMYLTSAILFSICYESNALILFTLSSKYLFLKNINVSFEPDAKAGRLLMTG